MVLRSADDDESGVISLDEFASNKQLQELVKEKIALEKKMQKEIQMLKMTQKRAGQSECSRIRAIFDEFDNDKNGHLDSSELKNILVDLGREATPQQAKILLKEIDKDNSGKIEFGEFLDWWPTVEQFLSKMPVTPRSPKK